jgi:ABC-type transport system substrate-binding protein
MALAGLLLCGCDTVWNDPYPAAERGANILYSSFVDRPKTLDPARAYAEDEWAFIQQIYVPPLQYHYLKRPYELVPHGAAAMPRVRYFDARGEPLPESAAQEDVAWSEYEIHVRPGMRFQPHPAFAVDASGQPRYLALEPERVSRYRTLSDFEATGTREVTAEDYIYQIRRLAHPRLTSPIFGHIAHYIEGLDELGKRLATDYAKAVADYQSARGKADPGYPWLDLRTYPLTGVTLVDRYTYRIRVRGVYPQFLYWLAMPFFAPMPVEAEQFYAQPGMNNGRNLTLDWYPAGSGPYMLTVNNPNARMVLERNPNFAGETYPTEGAPGDEALGLLADAGKPIPFIDRVVFSREKESIPLWNKFLQGYYDRSGIASDTFDQAVSVGFEGQASLTDEMKAKGIALQTSVATSTFYLAFNFLDPVVGGESETTRHLRQALSIAVDWEEYISIFANGRGIAGMGPLPPGIFGFVEGEAGVNRTVYDWVDGKPRRKSLDEARRLLAQAGFPDGRDARTGAPLVLYLDTVSRGPESKSVLDWYRRQFAKLDIQLEVRLTDWNRFQEKIRQGRTQLFFLGWNADYPDPENFMFLLYGPQSRAQGGGENAANYRNASYDAMFARMQAMPNGPERQAIITDMVHLLQTDAPWIWGFHPKDYSLVHDWMFNLKPSKMGQNGLKYLRIDADRRAAQRSHWNQPVRWPLALLLLVLLFSVALARRAWRRRDLRLGRSGA